MLVLQKVASELHPKVRNHGSSHFQPGEGPGNGLLRDCTTSPINRFAALIKTKSITFLYGIKYAGDGGELLR